jgi:hypothetical protein
MLIMFMDAIIGWVIDVSLSEQETCAMLIMFMNAIVGWVPDVSLSEQETCAMLLMLWTLLLGGSSMSSSWNKKHVLC